MEDLKNLLPTELRKFMESLGEPSYRGDQVFSWIHKHAVSSFDDMTNLSLTLRQKLKETAYITRLNVRSRSEGNMDTVKYLLETHDSNAIEAVRMEYRHGITACLSTQVGCKMACSFCASGLGGFVRNLTASEIVDEALRIHEDVVILGAHVGNIVLMVREPLDNYDASIRHFAYSRRRRTGDWLSSHDSVHLRTGPRNTQTCRRHTGDPLNLSSRSNR